MKYTLRAGVMFSLVPLNPAAAPNESPRPEGLRHAVRIGQAHGAFEDVAHLVEVALASRSTQ
jgi:hypothetical protein